MTLINYVFGAILIIFAIWRAMPVKGVSQIKMNELKEILKKKNYQFIDVRNPDEFNESNIKEFKNIPLNNLDNEYISLVSNKPVVLICQSGVRSMAAARLLKNKGFTNIINVKGGMNRWSE